MPNSEITCFKPSMIEVKVDSYAFPRLNVKVKGYNSSEDLLLKIFIKLHFCKNRILKMMITIYL
jgi:hypothetical protein